ncbi:PDR/VanB family oxidoreductase [Mycolicibacterium sp. CBMA 226]|uniref:PDR/VanB family oxidoreductase n=1 Tax=Mycolicibacterium sp. CBMA 226 TaxID=2606611 RepID=UPI00131911B0|nr:PDR/VanB family oxidoreductase [Mycolicibacterium sp. CBMA 226]QGW61306.1 Phenoxybenzoate dioxygenase subunit beta [Mycolicibacterium sp.]
MDLRVLEKRAIADDVVLLVLGAADGRRLPDWTPGAHVDLVLPIGLIRQYSLCGNRFDPFSYQIAVLREAAGHGGSRYVHDVLEQGHIVGVGGPRNNFPLVPSDSYLFIAGGIGITALLPMVVQADQLSAEWKLVYGGRRRASMAFAVELDALGGDRVVIVPHDELGNPDLARHFDPPRDGTKVYACGPPGLLTAVEAACSSWPHHALRTERFSAKHAPTSAIRASFEVRLARSGKRLTVPPDRTVLAALSDAGVDVLSSCERGVCGTCATTVLAGVPEHRDSLLDDEERAANDSMYVCVSRSLTDELVLDL